jgi:hypothetical protein
MVKADQDQNVHETNKPPPVYHRCDNTPYGCLQGTIVGNTLRYGKQNSHIKDFTAPMANFVINLKIEDTQWKRLIPSC